MGIKILVLEDEKAIRSFIKIKLRNEGYEVIECKTGKEALDKINSSICIALLDVMLPDIDGFEICKRMRKKYPNLGIIMVTAKGQEEDKITGLKGGADDYIVKPFSPNELIARIESLLRRLNIDERVTDENNIIEHGIFRLDINKKVLLKDDVVIFLTPTEYAIVEFFMNNPNKVFDRNVLLDEVWGQNYVGDAKIVDVNIGRIRKKIEYDSSKPKFLKTVWGYGYMWSYESE